jgi:hypothetical protein
VAPATHLLLLLATTFIKGVPCSWTPLLQKLVIQHRHDRYQEAASSLKQTQAQQQ